MNFSEMTLREIGEALDSGNLTTAQKENALYELKYRTEMTEYCAKGGDRPTHQPPNP